MLDMLHDKRKYFLFPTAAFYADFIDACTADGKLRRTCIDIDGAPAFSQPQTPQVAGGVFDRMVMDRRFMPSTWFYDTFVRIQCTAEWRNSYLRVRSQAAGVVDRFN